MNGAYQLHVERHPCNLRVVAVNEEQAICKEKSIMYHHKKKKNEKKESYHVRKYMSSEAVACASGKAFLGVSQKNAKC